MIIYKSVNTMKYMTAVALPMILALSGCGESNLETRKFKNSTVSLFKNTQALAITVDTTEAISAGGQNKGEMPLSAIGSPKENNRMDLVNSIRVELAGIFRENKSAFTLKKVRENFTEGCRITKELRNFVTKLDELKSKGEDTRILSIRIQAKAADLYTVIGLLITDLPNSPVNAARLKSIENKVNALFNQ